MKRETFVFHDAMDIISERDYNIARWACESFYMWECDTAGIIWC